MFTATRNCLRPSPILVFSQSQLYSSLPTFVLLCLSRPKQYRGNGEWGLQPFHNTSSLLLFLTFFPCSSVGPLCGLQSFRINWLLCVFSMGCSSFRTYPSAVVLGPPWPAVIPAPMWSSMGCKEIDASPWSSSWAAGEYLPQCLEHLLPHLLL